MVTMAQSAANWRNSHSHGSHAFTHIFTSTPVQSPTWCKAPAQLLFKSACWVFSGFRNPPNSNNYRIFIMRMRTNTRGMDIPKASRDSIFDLQKLTSFF